jgi:hypothetical protein
LINILREVFSDCVLLCGKPPKECEFILLALASLARSDATLYSDVECSLVVSEKSALNRDYFRILLRIFGFVISCIGEPEGFHLERGGLDDRLLSPKKEAVTFEPKFFSTIIKTEIARETANAIRRPRPICPPIQNWKEMDGALTEDESGMYFLPHRRKTIPL